MLGAGGQRPLGRRRSRELGKGQTALSRCGVAGPGAGEGTHLSAVLVPRERLRAAEFVGEEILCLGQVGNLQATRPTRSWCLFAILCSS